MSDHQIEDRDQEVINKFRSVVYAKERQKKKTKARRVFIAGITVCLIGLWAAYLFFSGETRTTPVKHYSARIAIDKAGLAETAPSESLSEGAAKPQASSVTAAGENRLIEKRLEVDNKPDQSNLNQTDELNQPAESLALEAEGFSEPGELADDSLNDIRVARLVTCRKVENKQFVSPQSEFGIEADGNPDVWVWMDVHSKKSRLPYLLRHVYYFNDRKYAAVVLNIKYPRMRTWSNLTLDNEAFAGKWRVEVVTEDRQTISEAGFTIVP